jgi:hypothetical protein
VPKSRTANGVDQVDLGGVGENPERKTKKTARKIVDLEREKEEKSIFSPFSTICLRFGNNFCAFWLQFPCVFYNFFAIFFIQTCRVLRKM